MSQSSTTRWLALPLVCLSLLLLLAALAYWLTQPTSPPPPPPEEPIAQAPPPAPTPPPRLTPPPVVPPPAFPSPQSEVPVPEQPDKRRVIQSEFTLEEIHGDFRPEDIEAALKAVTPLVQQCFQDAAQRNRGPQAVKLRFNLESRGEGEGRMDKGEVLASTIPDPMVQACVVDSLLDIGFKTPSRGGRATVVYPFEFRVPLE